MKQLLSLALALIPCLAWAQYPSNGNQKITLGEQTTADGLIWRGVLNDTFLINPSSDTSAYIILDTVNHRFYNYNRATNVWSVAGGGTAVTSITAGIGLTGGTIISTGTLAADTTFLFTQSDTLSLNLTNRFAAKQNSLTLTTTGTSGASTLIGSTLNIPQYSGGVSDGDKGDIDVTNSGATWTIDTSAVSLSGNKITGTLPVANGGTNASTFTAGSVVFAGNGGTYTQDNSNLFWNDTDNRLGIGTSSPTERLTINAAAASTSTNYQFKNISVTSGFTSGYTNNTIVSLLAGYDGPSIYGTDIGYGYDGTGYTLFFSTNDNTGGNAIERMRITSNGNVGIGQTTPTAVLHLKAGTATASTAPLKFTSGTNLTTAEAGAMEFNGTNLLFTPSTTRHTVNHGLTGSATLDFGSTNAQLSADLTITVTGAADGDVVSLGVPNAAVNANTSYSAWVSSANTVTVRFNNYSSGTVNPASGTFKVFVTK